jgi:hypothetical protein
MMAELMDLGVAVVASGDAIGCACGLDLIVFDLPVSQAFFLESGLKEAAAATAAKIIGAVGLHVDEVFFTYNGFHHKPQVVGNGNALAFSYNLTGILDRKFIFQVFVPVGINL